ncbi:MAG: hypothetical protein KIT54_09425 [Phycisphaeraceae bacterium]|nr:hypothetical protein [Phycisphaeraceae bacterium]
MVLLVIYAVAVWYGAIRWRRRWLGLLWVLGGILGVLIMIHFHVLLEAWTPYTIYLPVLQTLLWSYVLLVGSIGLFVVCIPHGRGLWCCQACGYDLTGVPGFSCVCPECGKEFAVETARAAEKRAVSILQQPIPSGDESEPTSRPVRDIAGMLRGVRFDQSRLAPQQPPHTAHQQDEQRHAQHEEPSQR